MYFDFSVLDFNEFLDVIIDKQGDDKDAYDEIVQGFKLFDTGNIWYCNNANVNAV